MAEGYEFENPTFDDKDIDKDIDEESETSFTDETEFQRTLTNQYEALNNLRGETQNKQRLNLLKMMVKRFYERNQEPVGLIKMRQIGLLKQIGLVDRCLGWNQMTKKFLFHTTNLTALMLFYSSIHLTHFKTSMVLSS